MSAENRAAELGDCDRQHDRFDEGDRLIIKCIKHPILIMIYPYLISLFSLIFCTFYIARNSFIIKIDN